MNPCTKKQRIGLKGELLLAAMPTLSVLLVLAIAMMILTDSIHPPAVSSALSFGLKAGDESNLLLFSMAVGITAMLAIIQRPVLWLLRRFNKDEPGQG